MNNPTDMMLRSVLARLDYWTEQAAQANAAQDHEREALCRRSIEEYSVLIQTLVAGNATSDTQPLDITL